MPDKVAGGSGCALIVVLFSLAMVFSAHQLAGLAGSTILILKLLLIVVIHANLRCPCVPSQNYGREVSRKDGRIA